MARNSVFRRNSIKLGLIALAVIILFGVVASITDTFVVGFEAVPFTVPTFFSAPQLSELALASNFAVDCRIWMQGDIVDVDGGRTPISPKTQTFNPQFELSVINIQTKQIIDKIDTEIRIRCDPGSVSGFTFGEVSGGLISTYTLTGGSVQYFWMADDEDNTERTVTSIVTRQIAFSDKVLQTPTAQGVQGSGITLASPVVTGTQIDNALTSNTETYFTSAKLVITAKPEFRFKLGCDAVLPIDFACAVDQTEFATVSLNAGIGTVKVFNQIIDPPKPTSEVVRLTQVTTEIDNVNQALFSDSTGNIDLVVRIVLPDWTTAEGVPQIDLFKPTATGASAVSTNFPITIKKNLESNCNPDNDSCDFQFSETNITIPNNPTAGNWIVLAKHPGRTGEDTKTFTVLKRGNQEAEDPIVIECDPAKDPDCSSTEQQRQEQEKQKEGANGEPGEDGGLSNILSIGDLIDCVRSGDFSCLNDAKYFPIYGIIAVIVLLMVLTSVGGRR